MAERDQIFSSKIKYDGIFNFSAFYKFCYDWLVEEIGLEMSEDAYKEKITGDSKNIDIEWSGYKKVSDYFRFDVKVAFQIIGLSKLELNQDGRKVKTNKGSVELKIKGTLVRDYKGKFEMSASKKFMRSVYEKFIIPSRIDETEGYIVGKCDEFLSQAKAYLDLEGKR